MRHELTPLLPVAFEKNIHLYTIILRHIFGVQGSQILADLKRVQDVQPITALDLYRLEVKYHVPISAIIGFLDSSGQVPPDSFKRLYEKTKGNQGTYRIMALSDSGLIAHDGKIIAFEEKGLTLTDVDNFIGFCTQIEARGIPLYRGKWPKPLALLDKPHSDLLKGRQITRYMPGRGYIVFPEWRGRLARVFPVCHAVITLGGIPHE